MTPNHYHGGLYLPCIGGGKGVDYYIFVYIPLCAE